MLQLPFRCWRGLDDCEPLHSIEGTPEEMTPEQYESPDFTPESFVCCGINHAASRELPQDCYRFCFKNAASDEMTDNDLQDLTHMAAVVTQALAITATRMVNGGTVEVPTMQVQKEADDVS
jgi:hypothetical protein